jgi:excisionase family DNA binding protein
MNKRDAAERLGVSTRLVERYAAEGRLGEVKYIRGKTGRQADFDEQAVGKLKAELEAPAFPPTALAAPHSPATALVAPQDRERFIAALEALAVSREQPRSGHVVVSLGEKIMLTLVEASALTNLSRNHLRQAIEDRKLKARIIGRGWRVKRDDLDAYVRKL